MKISVKVKKLTPTAILPEIFSMETSARRGPELLFCSAFALMPYAVVPPVTVISEEISPAEIVALLPLP